MWSRPMRGIPGEHLVRCAICPRSDIRSLFRWQVIQSPGFPTTKALVCKWCYDPPHPRVNVPKPRPVKSPDIIQDPYTWTDVTDFAYDTPTITSISPSTYSLATVVYPLQITVTGTNFVNDKSYFFIGEHRQDTTFINSTSLLIRLYSGSVPQTIGTHNVEVRNTPPPWGQESNTLTLTVTA